MWDIVKKAQELAIKAHSEQKYGEYPYSYHLEQVANLTKEIASKSSWFSPESFIEYAEAAAWLHDSVEDTSITIDDIVLEVNKDVAYYVIELTDAKGKNRKEKKLKTYARMAKLKKHEIDSFIILVVKLADRLCNVRECVKNNDESKQKMYRKEHDMFRIAVYRYISEWEPYMNELDNLLDIDYKLY